MPSEKYIIPDLDTGHLPETAENLRHYWRTREGNNTPDDYAKASPRRGNLLISLLNYLKPRPQSALEVGCNSGRNLYRLQQEGIFPLAGVDVRDCTEAVMRNFPEINASFCWGPAEEVLISVPDNYFDLVFSMAVLTHIPPGNFEIVARHMARIAKGCIITIEDEKRGWPIHHARNYRQVFEGLGFEQLMELTKMVIDNDLDYCYVARVMSRWEWSRGITAGE